ncbi:MAG TPA: protease complex subunit PrcB family protein [Pyrinomonadaceae bacterium]|jgi:hypothetical protein
MLRIRTSLIVLSLSLGMQGAGAAGCGTKESSNTPNTNVVNVNTATRPTPRRVEEAVNDEVKILAGGAYGKVNDAFVAVVRDVETYAAVRELINDLPQTDADFFKKNIVVAAFLGQRRTGGYGVEIALAENNRLRVSSTSPPAGSMTTQALTAPFKVVSIPDLEHRSLTIEIGPAWNNETRPYRVSSGEFMTGGGFGGRIERLQLAGDIRVSRLGKLATFIFDLKSSGGTKPRVLQNAATGIVGTDSSISGAVVDPGTLVDFPRSALAVKGSFAQNEDKLSLSFESLPSNVADGFSGQGKLEAAATAPPPPKKPKSDDAPM